MLIDDIGRDDLISALGTNWQCISDRVMGGVSEATLRHEVHAGKHCLHLTGDVQLENNGGFVQMALELDPGGGYLDARTFTGVGLTVSGNNERYAVHLRTADAVRPWQSYRAPFEASGEWHVVRLPFTRFVPHRLEAPLDLSRLRRLGVVAIGRAFHADLRLAAIELYR